MAYQVPEPKIFACTQSMELGKKIAKSYGADLGNAKKKLLQYNMIVGCK
jgi:hypothetical protein